MLAYTLKRIGLAALVAIAVSAVAFSLISASGDVAVALAGEGASAESVEAIRQAYGLDRPLALQYFEWVGKTLRGDFGESLYFKTDVLALVADKMPTTAWLALFSLVFALAISLPLGILAALHPNRLVDRLCLALAVLGQALPNFFFALVLIMVFAVGLHLLPVSGSESWENFVLPSIALGYYVAPPFMRLIRTGMIEVMASDYIRTARAKGLSGASIVLKHALRNALVPVVALAAVQLGLLLGGSALLRPCLRSTGSAISPISRSAISICR